MDATAHRLLWFPLALGAALAFAGHNGLGKKALREVTPLELALGSHLILALVVTLVTVSRAAMTGWHLPQVREGFWPAILATSAMNVVALLLMFAGIRSSPLSISVPYLSFTPVFILLTGRLLLGEAVGTAAGLCVLSVACGSWLLHLQEGSGFLGPFRALMAQTGPRNLLAVALIYSVSAVVDKMALLRADLLTFLMAASWTRIALMLPLFARRTPGLPGGLARIMSAGWPVGLMFSLEGFTHMAAISLGPVAYVVAVKRTSVLFSALLGFAAFGERRNYRVLGGILLMAGGAIALSVLSN
ncbi:MAG: EamA family transporter [bacterium]|nr:MAG: EamA family transporter [bacterium]